ncbi:hypothetical protein XA68_12679 [Ophiocordyceps unilateralis]|uniref:Uncharacterized protein n=1 Tax=Ophiocordyceps unilateralis TaxID=268505 RepID=A0A2A9PCE6_OPHUN|nr:hypothetical protein XA68_12679 [Ophiocordyceps unilateralis]
MAESKAVWISPLPLPLPPLALNPSLSLSLSLPSSPPSPPPPPPPVRHPIVPLCCAATNASTPPPNAVTPPSSQQQPSRVPQSVSPPAESDIASCICPVLARLQGACLSNRKSLPSIPPRLGFCSRLPVHTSQSYSYSWLPRYHASPSPPVLPTWPRYWQGAVCAQSALKLLFSLSLPALPYASRPAPPLSFSSLPFLSVSSLTLSLSPSFFISPHLVLAFSTLIMPSRLGDSTLSRSNLPRFELPALDLGFGRITDGTNIPPPPASPVQKVPTPPQTPPTEKEDPLDHKQLDDADQSPDCKDDKEPEGQDELLHSANGATRHLATPPNGNTAAPKRSDDDASLSPVGSGRESSLRRLFSRNVLSYPDAEGRSMSVGATSMAASRPESRGTTIVADDRRRKRGSAWFRRLRGGDSRRSTIYFDETAQVTVVPIKAPDLSPKPCEEAHQIPASPPMPVGPPPPMIPELVHLEKADGILGNDLFKNIK